MQEEIKLVSCQNLEGETLSFVILKNQQLGRGAFGSVKKAYQQNKEQEQLAVKIIKYGDQKSKSDINREIGVLRELEEHPNLVKVKPLQCFSEKNFYIFMEYCNQGTLGDQMKSKFMNKESFSEEEIFRAFYEILKGYEVLWKKGILHQDLKPDNILIKNGTYKIADFGFSIFYENVTLDKVRLGTCDYMPLEKLTQPKYDASTKSDVFSLGVIFFKMIIGRHPYVTKKYHDYKEFTALLRKSELNIPTYIKSRLSIPMQQLFDMILKMVAKNEGDRVDFEEIYQFINEQETFIQMENIPKESSDKFQSIQCDIEKKSSVKLSVKFVQVSKAFMIPFSIPRSQEDEYLNKLKNNKVKAEEKIQLEICSKLERYVCSMRIMVYFFDRLTRRLFVEKRKKERLNILTDSVAQIEQNAILGLVHAAKKITTQTMEDSFYQRVFTPEEWKIYKSTKPGLLKLVDKDEKYLTSLANQLAIQTKQSKIQDRYRIIENSKKPMLEFLSGEVRQLLVKLLKTRKNMIPANDKKALVTIYFILNAIDIIDNFKKRSEDWQELERFFRKIQCEEMVLLLEKVTEGLDALQIGYELDWGEWNE